MTFVSNLTGATLMGLAANDKPSLIFVPYSVYGALELEGVPMCDILSLKTMLKTLGVYGLANLLFANAQYNSGKTKILPDDIISGFKTFDLLDGYRDQATVSEDEALKNDYRELIKVYEGLKIKQTVLTDRYLRGDSNNDMSSNSDVEEYYVPELFAVSESVFGIRLKAITGLRGDNKSSVLRQTSVANIAVLGKRYSLPQIASLGMVKVFLSHCE